MAAAFKAALSSKALSEVRTIIVNNSVTYTLSGMPQNYKLRVLNYRLIPTDVNSRNGLNLNWRYAFLTRSKVSESYDEYFEQLSVKAIERH